MDGELYKLEMQGGKRIPVKVNKPRTFKGKCFKCDRTGHRASDCKAKAKADGSPLNQRKPPTKPNNNNNNNNNGRSTLNNMEPQDGDVDCGLVDLAMLVVDDEVIDIPTFLPPTIDPWLRSDPWSKGKGPTAGMARARYTLEELRQLESWLSLPASPVVYEIVDDDVICKEEVLD